MTWLIAAVMAYGLTRVTWALGRLVWWRLSWSYRFGACDGCGSSYCPRVGPWYARRRLHAMCPGCMPELYPDQGVA